MTSAAESEGDNVIAAQQEALAALYRQHVGHGDRYALLDFPDHANVGDSAIWLGEIAMLRAITGRDPDHVCTWDAFDADAFCLPPRPVAGGAGDGILGRTLNVTGEIYYAAARPCASEIDRRPRNRHRA